MNDIRQLSEEQFEELLKEGLEHNSDGIISFMCGLCLCGRPEGVDKLLFECLEFSSRDEARFSPHCPEEWNSGFYRSPHHELIAKVLDAVGLVDHGTGIGWAWITPRGEKVLEAAKKIEEEDAKSGQ